MSVWLEWLSNTSCLIVPPVMSFKRGLPNKYIKYYKYSKYWDFWARGTCWTIITLRNIWTTLSRIVIILINLSPECSIISPRIIIISHLLHSAAIGSDRIGNRGLPATLHAGSQHKHVRISAAWSICPCSIQAHDSSLTSPTLPSLPCSSWPSSWVTLRKHPLRAAFLWQSVAGFSDCSSLLGCKDCKVHSEYLGYQKICIESVYNVYIRNKKYIYIQFTKSKNIQNQKTTMIIMIIMISKLSYVRYVRQIFDRIRWYKLNKNYKMKKMKKTKKQESSIWTAHHHQDPTTNWKISSVKSKKYS